MARSALMMVLISALMLVAARPATADFMMLWFDDDFRVPATATLPMAVGDMNGDNVMEIVGKFGTATEVRDAMTGTLIKQFPAYSYAVAYAMVDLDGDGTPECIGSGENSFSFVIDWVLVAGTSEPPSSTTGANLEIHPNPGFAGAEIAFSIPARTEGQLRIYDPSGRSVRVLANRPFDTGKQVISWDGRDEKGARLSPGVYFVELRLNDGAQSHRGKVVLN